MFKQKQEQFNKEKEVDQNKIEEELKRIKKEKNDFDKSFRENTRKNRGNRNE